INLKENGTATEPIYGIHNKAYLEGSGNQSAGIKVLARCNTSSVGSKYGLHVFLKKTGGGFGTGSRYAIYAKVNSTDTDHFAGFFDGNVCINGSLNHGSDRRLKQNIRSLDNALSMVLSLAPKRYDFRDNIFGVSLPMGEQVGLIAQEVEVILPEIVKEVRVASSPEEGEDTSGMELLDSYKTINYQSLVPVLVGAIKEQQQIIQDLEARIQALEQ
ncbi:MAG: tail fiber domain-containing protein, partial [Bacteroidota bacterium]